MIAVAAGLDAPCLDSDADRDLEPTPKKRGGGPRTPEGKERSKRNSLRHGMLAEVIFPDDLAAAIADRTADLVAEFVPATPFEAFLIGEMAKATAKLDRCSEMAIVDLQRVSDRAVLCWDGDRRAYVEDLGARLPRDPARVARALGRTKQGVDWLLERWEGLGEVLQAQGGWDEPQRRLAFDLLGVPAELRDGSLKVPPAADAPGLAGLVDAQVARLREEQEACLIELDEATRSMAAAGMPFEEDAATARLRKYEAAARRALLWALSELRRVRSGSPAPGAGESPRRTGRSRPVRRRTIRRSRRSASTRPSLSPRRIPRHPPSPRRVPSPPEAGSTPTLAKAPVVVVAAGAGRPPAGSRGDLAVVLDVVDAGAAEP